MLIDCTGKTSQGINRKFLLHNKYLQLNNFFSGDFRITTNKEKIYDFQTKRRGIELKGVLEIFVGYWTLLRYLEFQNLQIVCQKFGFMYGTTVKHEEFVDDNYLVVSETIKCSANKKCEINDVKFQTIYSKPFVEI